ADTDGDSLRDGDEVTEGTDPLNPDSDNDGIGDGTEVALGSDPLNLASVPPDPLTITGVEVFRADDPGVITTRDGAPDSFDGNIDSWNFLTPAFTDFPNIVALDLGEATSISALRVAKWGDTDGAGPGSGAPGIAPLDHMDIQILFTTDGGPLNERTYLPVSGLANSVGEPINADGIDAATATVDNDRHDFANDGWYMLTFDSVPATALAVRFERDAGDSAPWTHYGVLEFEIRQVAAPGPLFLTGFEPDFEAGTAVVTWESSPGVDYTIQRSSTLVPEGWLDVDDFIPSQGTMTSHTIFLPKEGGELLPDLFVRVVESN
ncbi:MAG: hypothetical protein GWO24_17045, partial [Akkermansiaceae bacterium]|nr:hypothetical protein [Akkermansiaceae bacterium]